MSNKQYAHVALDDANGLRYRNDFQSGYENQFPNDIDRPRRTSPGLLRNVQLRWWCWELVAAAISLALFSTVVIVLKVYDGHAIPQLPLGITLNTMVSLIATVSKTALLLVASATMSQFKWLWIHKSSRKLRDLQAFDEASRGPWGALILLQHSKFSLASLGALVTLLLLGFDPFIQQLITTPQRDLSYEAASTAVLKASAFSQYSQIESYNDRNDTLVRLAGFNPYNIIESTVSNGASTLGSIADFAPTCPTANCSWPTFKSIGLCSTCMNVTDYARKNWNCEDGPSQTVAGTSYVGYNRTCNYNLPNSAFNYEYSIFHDGTGSNYTEVAGELRLNAWTTITERTTFSDNTFVLVSYMAFENPGNLVPGIGREQVLEATECALAMCVQEHDLSVRLGITNHTVKSTQQPFSVSAGNDVGLTIEHNVKSAQIDGVTYSVDGINTLPVLLGYIEDTWYAQNITVDYTTTSTPGSPVKYDGGVNLGSPVLATSFFAGQNFTQAVENMATSVSQYIRSLSNDTTTGQSHTVEVYIHVKWRWMAFPIVLVVGGIALLVIAIVQTSRSGLEVWKSSSLPIWFHGPQNGRVNSFGSQIVRVNTLVEMETEAGQIHVTLEKMDDESGAWKLLPIQNSVKSGFI